VKRLFWQQRAGSTQIRSS